MAKYRQRIDQDPRQLNLFDYIREMNRSQNPTSEGGLNIKDRLRRALNDALKQSLLSRHQVAGEMSHLLGVEVTKTTIDSWTAESKDGHRIPAEYIPAFCKATDNYAALAILEEASGRFSMPGPEALRAEIQRSLERIRSEKTELRKMELFLKEMERR
jgi:hypothetical protein